jgi:hypothetical protein
MRNKNVDWDDSYNYSPNELAQLSIDNPRLYREVIESNLDSEDSVENWEQRNLDWAKEQLKNPAKIGY